MVAILRDAGFRRWAYAPAIHASSLVDHEDRVVWFSISMCSDGSFSIVTRLRLAALRPAELH